MKITKKEVAPTFDITGLSLEQMQELVALIGGLVRAGVLYDVLDSGADALGGDREFFADLYETKGDRIGRK